MTSRNLWQSAVRNTALTGLCAVALQCAAQIAPVGQRPYELVWANRVQDDHSPLVDFEELSGWKVECSDAQAAFSRTREQQIWGEHVGKLTYRGIGANPQVRILPPQPVPLPGGIEAVTLWCYGNNWGWTTDPSTPRVQVSILLEDSAGRESTVFLYTVDWKEWYLLHKRLTPDQTKQFARGGRFKGLLIGGGRNTEDRTLYFDNLAFFAEQFPPLKFDTRAKRGIEVFPGQAVGANAGPGRLPFPTRDTTILPNSLDRDGTNWVAELNNAGTTAFVFHYQGASGDLSFRLAPATGTWTDLSAQWSSPGGPARAFAPCTDGGVFLTSAKGAVLPNRGEHLGTHLGGERVESRWRLTGPDGASAEVLYAYRILGKSLVIDVIAPAGGVSEVRFGRLTGLPGPRLVTNPFYPAENGRPAVVVTGDENDPLFVAGNVDWYRSNGSVLWAANSVTENGVTYNGGTRYLPLTDGRRNPSFERFIITVSPRYEEVLPNIPNPSSPWRHITGTRVWRAHGASNREQDKKYWEDVHRHGITHMVVTDHETLWRDEGESFTFRTKAAPGKGGDDGARDYARFMQDKLGFVYGPYNNFTDFAPVNEFWSFDLISRDPQNQLQHAWMRCYAPKPARAVEFCQRLAPQIQEKFRFSTAYCDVHTAVAPWHRVDYDPRVPGAGTFAAVFYSYGEIMLLQKQAWQGPVYSEGNYHCFYMGLTDGNYGQDQSYRPAENPWLVDFDLRKMHDLGCNFGMGSMDMFYASKPQPKETGAQRDTEVDRFLAATVAFGHPGFLVMEGGMANGLRSYYMLQQLHSRYCLTNAVEIGYVTADRRLLDTSRAVAGGAFKRSQVVTRYADGTVTAANGSKTERLQCEAFGRSLDLPPNGYAGWTTDGSIEVLSGDSTGERSDYAVTPAYIYIDGRGKFVRHVRAAGNGIGVCRSLPGAQHEVILHGDAECGFAVDAGTAEALDKERRTTGPARIRMSRGLVYIQRVPGAFSYLLKPSAAAANPESAPPVLECSRTDVVPGETVTIKGKGEQAFTVPAEAKPGDRLWREIDGAWIDFTIVPLVELEPKLEGNTLKLAVRSHLAAPADFTADIAGRKRSLQLEPEKSSALSVDLGAPETEGAETLRVRLSHGSGSEELQLGIRVTRDFARLIPMPATWTSGMRMRGAAETADFGTSATVVNPQSVECGKTSRSGLFMHPPWQGGTGYAFALYEPVSLPPSPPAAIRANVGKGNGSDPGDGILYKLSVVDSAGRETIVAETTVLKHEWTPLEADLTAWAGQKVRFKLITDAGPRDDSTGDWGAWADMRIETLKSVLHRTEEGRR